jgi:hypothetical protein
VDGWGEREGARAAATTVKARPTGGMSFDRNRWHGVDVRGVDLSGSEDNQRLVNLYGPLCGGPGEAALTIVTVNQRIARAQPRIGARTYPAWAQLVRQRRVPMILTFAQMGQTARDSPAVEPKAGIAGRCRRPSSGSQIQV